MQTDMRLVIVAGLVAPTLSVSNANAVSITSNNSVNCNNGKCTEIFNCHMDSHSCNSSSNTTEGHQQSRNDGFLAAQKVVSQMKCPRSNDSRWCSGWTAATSSRESVIAQIDIDEKEYEELRPNMDFFCNLFWLSPKRVMRLELFDVVIARIFL